jgi:hypothetical protein
MSFIKEVEERREEYKEFVNNTLKPSIKLNIMCMIEQYALDKKNKYLDDFIKCDYINDDIKLELVNNRNNYLGHQISSVYSNYTRYSDLNVMNNYYFECEDIFSKLNKEEIIYNIYKKVYDGCVISVTKKDNHEFLINVSLK